MVDIPIVRVTQVSQLQVVAEFFEFPQLQFVEKLVVIPVAVQASRISLRLGSSWTWLLTCRLACRQSAESLQFQIIVEAMS